MIVISPENDYSRWVNSQMNDDDWLVLKELKSSDGTLKMEAFDISRLP